jgi:hypothetical protein
MLNPLHQVEGHQAIHNGSQGIFGNLQFAGNFAERHMPIEVK